MNHTFSVCNPQWQEIWDSHFGLWTDGHEYLWADTRWFCILSLYVFLPPFTHCKQIPAYSIVQRGSHCLQISPQRGSHCTQISAQSRIPMYTDIRTKQDPIVCRYQHKQDTIVFTYQHKAGSHFSQMSGSITQRASVGCFLHFTFNSPHYEQHDAPKVKHV